MMMLKEKDLTLLKIRKIGMAILLLIIGTLYLFHLNNHHNWGGDFAYYILHAKNLVEGHGYSGKPFVYNPQYPSLSPRLYPPLFPLLLAPLYALFGLNIAVFKGLVLLTFLFSISAVYLLATNHFKNDLTPLFIAGLYGLNPWVNHYLSDVKPDYLFVGLVYFTLFIYEKYDESPIKRSIFAGVLSYLAYADRSAAIVLIAAIVLNELFKRPRCYRCILISSGIFSIGAIIQGMFIKSISSYHFMFMFNIKNILLHIITYSTMPYFIWDNGMNQVISITLTFIFMSLVLIGLLKKLKHKIGAEDFFFILYFLLIIVWPYYVSRYFLPLIPLIIFYLFKGLQLIIPKSWSFKASTAVTIIILGIYAVKFSVVGLPDPASGIHTETAQELFTFVKNSIPEQSRILFAKPRVLALFTDHESLTIQLPLKEKQITDLLKKFKVKYVIISKWSPSDMRYLLPFILRQVKTKGIPNFEPIYKNKDFIVFKVMNL